MDRSVWKRLCMMIVTAVGGLFCAIGGPGCTGDVPQSPPSASNRTTSNDYPVRRPAVATSNRPDGEFARDTVAQGAGGGTKPELSWDTERDGRFARFLEEKSAGLVKKAAVGIERRGTLKIEITRAVTPEETLPLTRSLMEGARKDFPDKRIILSLYDPEGAPILKARFRPGQGVDYKIAHDEGTKGDASTGTTTTAENAHTNTNAGHDDLLTRGGVTERDRKFALWAEEHGKDLLRYVEADLERHGRLWFGVTHKVKPAEVKPLAQSLLQGARKEFPRGELVATVFDPDGQRIGRAHFDREGAVHWEK
ncbi:MAG: hypothetical protein NVSMB9_29930 [Isosphaeraceae bacterium]